MTRTARPLKGHAFHSKSDDELRFVILDATEARDACSHDERAASKYADQVCDAATILNYRKGIESMSRHVTKTLADRSRLNTVEGRVAEAAAKGEPKFVECAPTWGGILPLLLAAFERNPHDQGIRIELQRMADLADKFIQLSKGDDAKKDPSK
jgi:hypothetical protein